MSNHSYEEERNKYLARKHRANFDTFMNVEVVKQTEKAYQVKFEDETRWIPKSIAEYYEAIIEKTGEKLSFIHIPKWFVKKNNIPGAYVYGQW